MSSSGVLVTGVGGPAGTAVVREASRLGYRVVGVDADEHAAGFRFCNAAETVPLASDPDYLDGMLAACSRHSARIIVPTLTEEMGVLSDAQVAVEAAGVRIWVPDRAAVALASDKLACGAALAAAGVPVAETALVEYSAAIEGPWIVKPRFGRGSRHVGVARTQRQLEVLAELVPSPIMQPLLSGREFTVDYLADDSRLRALVPRWRLATRGGITTKGAAFRDDAVAELAATTVRALGLTAAGNVQGFATPDGPVVTEVNPRFSGGLPVSLIAGADLVGQYLNAVRGIPIDESRLAFHDGIVVSRYFDEFVCGTPAGAAMTGD